MLVTPAEFPPFQSKVRPLRPHDSPPATGSLTSADQGDGITTHDDPPPATQQLPPVTDSMDGENQQQELFTTERGPWSTKAEQSNKDAKEQTLTSSSPLSFRWALCNVDAGADYIPCLDNVAAIKKLRSTKHYEHRERHCPEKSPTCLVPLPEGYRNPIRWPKSRDQVCAVP